MRTASLVAFVALVSLSAASFADETWQATGEIRVFSGSNVHFEGGLERSLGRHRLGLRAVTFDNTGPDLVLGSEWRSQVTLVEVYARGDMPLASSASGDVLLGVEAAVNFVGEWKSRTAGSESDSKQPIPAIAVPFIWQGTRGERFWLRPAITWFDARQDVSTGGTVPGFGTTTTLEVGASTPIGAAWTASASGALLLGGYNSVDPGGTRGKRTGYEARLRYQRPSDNWSVSLFVSNQAGSGTAARTITGHDDCVGVAAGVRF
ncbi:MAG: hypothetical protein GX446_01435 [Chthonomonadales bacterium]|nr:hypothetical protein [Chthonomonadales bacterium]